MRREPERVERALELLRPHPAMAQARAPGTWRDAADAALADLSWDATQSRMAALLDQARRQRSAPAPVDRFPAPGIRRGARGYDVTICGAGFAGSVLARKLAEDSGQRVLVVDKRPHIGGNAFDTHDDAGVAVAGTSSDGPSTACTTK